MVVKQYIKTKATCLREDQTDMKHVSSHPHQEIHRGKFIKKSLKVKAKYEISVPLGTCAITVFSFSVKLLNVRMTWRVSW